MNINYKTISYYFLILITLFLIAGFINNFSYSFIKNPNLSFLGTIWFFIVLSIIIYLIILFFGSYLIQLNFHIKSLNNGNKKKNKISITFDDGPNNEITEELLNVLKSHNITATFFMIGKNIEQNKELTKKVFEQGHTIGNHSYYHANMFDMQTSKKMLEEITKTNSLIKSIINKTPLLFRPPFGITNPMLAKAVKKSKMYSIGWSLRSLDTIKTKKNTLLKLKHKVKNGDIILLHDNNKKIIEIVDEFIKHTKEIGIKIVSIEELLKIKPYK